MARFSRSSLNGKKPKKKNNPRSGKKCVYQGVEFDSILERDFYICLLDLKSKNLPFDFEYQRMERLIETKPKSDKQPITYNECINGSKVTIDFYIPLDENMTIVVDTKGYKPTARSRLAYNILREKWWQEGKHDHLVLFVNRRHFNIIMTGIERYLNGETDYFKRISHKMR